ncbi:bestrophin family protein [Methylorubrum extorquens]|uniref:Bestrophin family protein n=1 Tax=Methylorubrum extorquens TaxID=408 RepID=A0AAX3WIB4_METEX|nr:MULTISPECIES: bestrophin family protein [Methylobacteriaceae]KQO92575.1 bestrophin [Methylobacterium sp. Leaf92]KQQ20351.1 bestrophin [Methylobacterium sp. Leaf122]WHQ70400.1 bestrophin family protein [Methylorubrum extorquens]
MIVRPRPGLLTILFAMRGSILPKVAPQVIVIAALSFLVVAIEQRHAAWFPVTAGIGPFTLVGLALSIFLSFRNGACYDRWWEARRAWGSLIVELRGLARLLPALLPEPEHEALCHRCLRRGAGFAHALHARLRGLDETEALAPWLPPEEVATLGQRPSGADTALTGLTRDLAGAAKAGALSDVLFVSLEHKIASLSAIQATCERIHGTPLPFAYTLLLYRTAWLYCLLLPFGLAGSLGWSTPIIAALVAYAFFGLDALGDELEEPFGTDANDLPLDALLHTADAAILDALGETGREAPKADRFMLR